MVDDIGDGYIETKEEIKEIEVDVMEKVKEIQNKITSNNLKKYIAVYLLIGYKTARD